MRMLEMEAETERARAERAERELEIQMERIREEAERAKVRMGRIWKWFGRHLIPQQVGEDALGTLGTKRGGWSILKT